MVRTKSNTEEQSNQSDAVSFESALERLEEITDQLENGELGLDDSLKTYTEGIALARRCNQQLTLAEEKVAKLLSADGTLTDFSINESEGKSGQ